MDYIAFIERVDNRIELVRNAWSNSLIELLKKTEMGTKKYQHQSQKLANKYGPLVAELLDIRRRAYSRACKVQDEEYARKFEEVTTGESIHLDENGRPKDFYWKDGTWHRYNRNKNDKKED